MMHLKRRFVGLLVGVLVYLAPAAAHSDAFLTGVNFVHPISFSIKDQNDTLPRIKASAVRVIRFGMEDKEDENLDFIKRAYAQNIQVVLIFLGKYAPGAPVRPYRPTTFPACGKVRRSRL